MIKKTIKDNFRSYGELGTYTDIEKLFTGDMLTLTNNDDEFSFNVLVVYDKEEKRFSAYGMLAYSLETILSKYEWFKAIDCRVLDNDIINKFMPEYIKNELDEPNLRIEYRKIRK